MKPQGFSFPEAPAAPQWLHSPLRHSLPFQLHSCFHHPYRVHQGICDKGCKNKTRSAAESRPLYCQEPCTLCSDTSATSSSQRCQKPHRCSASNFMVKFRRHQSMDSSFLHLFPCAMLLKAVADWFWNSSPRKPLGTQS